MFSIVRSTPPNETAGERTKSHSAHWNEMQTLCGVSLRCFCLLHIPLSVIFNWRCFEMRWLSRTAVFSGSWWASIMNPAVLERRNGSLRVKPFKTLFNFIWRQLDGRMHRLSDHFFPPPPQSLIAIRLQCVADMSNKVLVRWGERSLRHTSFGLKHPSTIHRSGCRGL